MMLLSVLYEQARRVIHYVIFVNETMRLSRDKSWSWLYYRSLGYCG